MVVVKGGVLRVVIFMVLSIIRFFGGVSEATVLCLQGFPFVCWYRH
jgi:hypothetical protein